MNKSPSTSIIKLPEINQVRKSQDAVFSMTTPPKSKQRKNYLDSVERNTQNETELEMKEHKNFKSSYEFSQNKGTESK